MPEHAKGVTGSLFIHLVFVGHLCNISLGTDCMNSFQKQLQWLLMISRQQFSLGVIWQGHYLGNGTTGMRYMETRDAAQHPVMSEAPFWVLSLLPGTQRTSAHASLSCNQSYLGL